jgi:glycosidase
MYWHEEAIFYSMYALSQCGAPFYNDYSGTTERLGEIEKWIGQIKKTGCNALVLSPVFKSRTHGYDTTDCFQIDNRIGTNESFRALVDKLHENGIRVALDAVFNHCGRDFFAFRDVLENREGSNYKGWISGLRFDINNDRNDGLCYDTWSGYSELVKFNLNNQDVVRYLLDAAKSWATELDIDGLRLDSANVLDFGFMKELRSEMAKVKPDFWLMGEVVHGDYSKWANSETLHSATNYELYKGLFSSHNNNNLFELAHTLNREFGSGGLHQGKLLYNFADNHDQDRLASVVSDPGHLYTIYTLLYCVPGLPSIYYGSEWGIKGKRENGSDSGVRPFIDLDAQRDEPDLEKVISKLADIRLSSPALKWGDYKQVALAYQKPFAFERTYEGETVVVAVNIGDVAEQVDLSQYHASFWDLLNNERVEEGQLKNLSVSPHWSRILKKM